MDLVVQMSKEIVLNDHPLNSCDLSNLSCNDIKRRDLMLVTFGGLNVSLVVNLVCGINSNFCFEMILLSF